jgi:hypothetical protein
MTIEQIYAWIKAILGQPHAIGRYQFIPATLRRLVDITGIDKGAVLDAGAGRTGRCSAGKGWFPRGSGWAHWAASIYEQIGKDLGRLADVQWEDSLPRIRWQPRN